MDPNPAQSVSDHGPGPGIASGATEAGIMTTGTFDGSAPIYQWDDEYGDVGPKMPELELELFGDPSTRHERTGLDFSRFVIFFLICLSTNQKLQN